MTTNTRVAGGLSEDRHFSQQDEEPAFLDYEGPQEPPTHICTLRLHEILARLSEKELAAWSGTAGKIEINRRRRIAQEDGGSSQCLARSNSP